MKRPRLVDQRTQRAGRGYTVVELMMAVAMFAVGVTGILGLMLATSTANANSRDVAVATALARSWQDRLAMDASLWGGIYDWNITKTTWLQKVLTQDNTWILPDMDSTTTFGPAANRLGQFVNHTTAPEDAFFCTHIRLTELIDSATQPGSGLLRAEVRVFWPTGEVGWDGNYCEAAAAIDDIAVAESQFDFVYMTSAIRQSPNF